MKPRKNNKFGVWISKNKRKKPRKLSEKSFQKLLGKVWKIGKPL